MYLQHLRLFLSLLTDQVFFSQNTLLATIMIISVALDFRETCPGGYLLECCSTYILPFLTLVFLFFLQEPVFATTDYYGQIPIPRIRLLPLSIGKWTPELREPQLSGKCPQAPFLFYYLP
jgi:hypothetical protein